MDYQTATLGEIATFLPGATQVFRKHKLDFCCSGDRTISVALLDRPGEAAKVLADLKCVIPMGENLNPAFYTPVHLIQYILKNYHEKHRRDLPELILLAKKVEAVHADKPFCPKGLAKHLEFILVELEDHMQKEEKVLFPAIEQNLKKMLDCPISTMKVEHIEHGKNIEKLEKLIFNFEIPSGACNTWRALILGAKAFSVDITEHIHLENNVLFPKVLE
jgi:regulator of cell morphogenesis and NO signaling